MGFERDLSTLNEFYFFQEFTFSQTTFRPSPAKELELADNIIWLRDLMLLYQVKERHSPEETSPAREERWFKRKVLGEATRQIRDTLGYFQQFKTITLKNHRRHEWELNLSVIQSIHKLVVYLPHDCLPAACRTQKHHWSRTAGCIHLIAAVDYLGIVRTLLTPAEVSEHFDFREKLISMWGERLRTVSEQAVVGQYLLGDLEVEPSEGFMKYVRELEHKADEWDMSTVIKLFQDRTDATNDPTNYYPILREIAGLVRNELAPFKERFRLSMEKAQANEFTQPYRMTVPRTGCGFVFIPLVQQHVANRRLALENLTAAHKYDHRLSKCIGATFGADANGWCSVEWCYLEHSWIVDPEMDRMLREANPFREVSAVSRARYSFRKSEYHATVVWHPSISVKMRTGDD